MRSAPMHVSRWRRGQLLLLVVLLASKATAGSSPSAPVAPAPLDGVSGSPVVNVSWADIARLVEQHPRLAAGKLQVDVARGGLDAAGAVPNPTLEATLGQGRARFGDDSRVEWGVSLSIPLSWIVQRGSKISAAEAEVAVAEAESKALRRDVLLQLQTLFWNLVFEQARLASLKELVAQTMELVVKVSKRVEKGDVRPVEATRVEIELEKVTSELEAASISLASRQALLALWLAVPPGKTVVAVAELSSLSGSMTRDSAFAKLRETHPALLATRAKVLSLTAEVDTEKMGRVPTFSLTGFTTHELDRRAYGVGLAVDLPIFNWNSGRIAQAEAKVVAGRKQVAAVAFDLDAMVIEAQAACEGSRKAAIRFGAQVVPRAQTAASTMEKTYQIGEVSLLELLDSRRTLLDARRLHLSALAQAQIDCSRLSVLVGEDTQ